MQTVRDKVVENAALLKELWEGRRTVKELQHSQQRLRDQIKALQLEYDQFRLQVGVCVRVSVCVCACLTN